MTELIPATVAATLTPPVSGADARPAATSVVSVAAIPIPPMILAAASAPAAHFRPAGSLLFVGSSPA